MATYFFEKILSYCKTTLKTSLPDKKEIWKFKNVANSLPPTTVSKVVTEINYKERELRFHTQFIYRRVHISESMEGKE